MEPLKNIIKDKKFMADEFLPKDYEVPQASSNYMRFQEGINRFRILGSAITGFEYWTGENKPVRSKGYPITTPNGKINPKTGNVDVKTFWAFPVWNYQTKMIQILQITQKSIMTGVKGLVDNPKWGSPFQYDIAVTKTGEGLDTEYHTQGEPPLGEPSDEIKNAFMEKPIQLGALLVGEDPFSKV